MPSELHPLEVIQCLVVCISTVRTYAGHNVRYVGDRKRRTNQLNGKSSNLNHILLSHIYPDVNHSNEVSWKDIIVVMDCDHLVTPAYFQKCCSVLLNKDVAVCLVPQAFHNLIKPDFFDNRNANFMFRLMPYYFGAGCCFITGTTSFPFSVVSHESCVQVHI